MHDRQMIRCYKTSQLRLKIHFAIVILLGVHIWISWYCGYLILLLHVVMHSKIVLAHTALYMHEFSYLVNTSMYLKIHKYISNNHLLLKGYKQCQCQLMKWIIIYEKQLIICCYSGTVYAVMCFRCNLTAHLTYIYVHDRIFIYIIILCTYMHTYVYIRTYYNTWKVHNKHNSNDIRQIDSELICKVHTWSE